MRFTPGELTDKMLAGMSEKDRKELGLKNSLERTAAHQVKAEKDLQRQCEQFLMFSGYFPRTPVIIEKLPELIRLNQFKGWYVHLHKTKKNPLLLDLLILAGDSGKWIEIELKTKGGIIRNHQKTLLTNDPTQCKICYSIREFRNMLLSEGFVKGEILRDEFYPSKAEKSEAQCR